MAAIADLQAYLVIILLTWAAVSVSGTTPALFTTTGGTVNIPCLYGQGTLRYILWYYNDRTGPQKILILAKGILTIAKKYAHRASLQNDNSTLILKGITAADEGTYKCVVNRHGQTSVYDFETNLILFCLRHDRLPWSGGIQVNTVGSVGGVFTLADIRHGSLPMSGAIQLYTAESVEAFITPRAKLAVLFLLILNFTLVTIIFVLKARDSTIFKGIHAPTDFNPRFTLSSDEKQRPKEKRSKNAKDGSSATGNFGALGGKLSTKSHGYTLHIPPGALEEDVQISLKVLTDIPKSLTLKEDELLVSHGFQCYPSGLRFKKPAKLIIPHCAIVTAPNKVQTVLYSWNQAGTPKRLPGSSDIICSVQEWWLEVSVSHFSGGFFALIWDWIFVKGILLSCMSFLPRVLNPSKETLLEVCFAKKQHGQKWTDVHELNDPDVQHVKRDDDEFELRKETLTVTCQLGKKSPKSDVHNIRYSDFSMQTKVTEYFELDFAKESDETLVTLEVVQTSTRTIKFFTCFQGQLQETATGSSSAAMSAATSTSRREVTDEEIDKLSKMLPDKEYKRLGSILGFHFNYVVQILRKNLNDYRAAFEEILQEWNNKEGFMEDLDAALIKADLGKLVSKYKN